MAETAIWQPAAALATAEHANRRGGWIPATAAARSEPPAELVARWCARLTEAANDIDRWTAVGFGDARYPRRLAQVPTAPAALFGSGRFDACSAAAVAVVGSRSASGDACAAAAEIAAALSTAGAVVVSGLAAGIDSAAHRAVLDAGGETVAVVGTGLGVVYPPQNVQLAGRIVRQGALVSQFPPYQPPTPGAFLARNAVIAGLCDASVAVAARAASGTRNELDAALRFGRRVVLWAPELADAAWAEQLTKSGRAVMASTVAEVLEACLAASAPNVTGVIRGDQP